MTVTGGPCDGGEDSNRERKRSVEIRNHRVGGELNTVWASARAKPSGKRDRYSAAASAAA
jgi:hypothetical protein